VHDSDLAYTPALEQARMIREGELSPVELVDVYLNRIEEANPDLKAYITVADDYAREQARIKADMVGKEDLPPLHGVVVSIKDLYMTKGIRTTKAQKDMIDFVPDFDEEVVKTLKRAGCIIIGKTNVPERGIAVFTETPTYGPCRNPWDRDRTPGGSSGGAASAQAAGLASLSHGSDGGGSIRQPSAWTGLYGIKPSRGRVSWHPNPPLGHGVHGPMTHTVADGAAMLDAMLSYVEGDDRAPDPERPFLEEVGRPPGRLRIAFTAENDSYPYAVAPGNVEGVLTTAKLLEELGHDVVQADPPWIDLNDPDTAVRNMCIGFAANAESYGPLEDLDPIIRSFIEYGQSLGPVDENAPPPAYMEPERWQKLVGFFDDYDVLVTPTVAVPPSKIGEFIDPEDPFRGFKKCLVTYPFTGNWNVTGQPAVSVPLHMDELGLPVGIQLVGRPNDDATLIRLSAQLEAARPWKDRRPAGF
jgi:amidase